MSYRNSQSLALWPWRFEKLSHKTLQHRCWDTVSTWLTFLVSCYPVMSLFKSNIEVFGFDPLQNGKCVKLCQHHDYNEVQPRTEGSTPGFIVSGWRQQIHARVCHVRCAESLWPSCQYTIMVWSRAMYYCAEAQPHRWGGKMSDLPRHWSHGLRLRAGSRCWQIGMERLTISHEAFLTYYVLIILINIKQSELTRII